MSLKPNDMKELYRSMLLIRRFEETAFEKALEGAYYNYHGGMGQEANPAGVCHGLRKTDMTMITHRGLGVLIARGISVKDIFAGLYAKEPSPTRGRIPVYHMAEPSLGVLGGTSMVGSVIPLAVGSALATKLQGRDDVTVSFFGDGAVNRGDFHEGVNLASVRKLPIVFFCENNFYAKSTPLPETTAGGSIVARAGSYGIPGECIDGNDVIAVHETVRTAVARARAGEGPTLIECETYRWTPHSTAGDREFARTEEELALWKTKCPVLRLEKKIMEKGHMTEEELNAVYETIKKEVAEAVEFAEAAPYAAADVAFENVYV